jgi:hypothetical protein
MPMSFIHQTAAVGIPDRDSWLLRDHYPTGRARGWRRAGCLVLLVGAMVLIVVAVVAAMLA